MRLHAWNNSHSLPAAEADTAPAPAGSAANETPTMAAPACPPIPLHAIWRTREDIRSLRGKKLWRQIRKSFRRCCEKEGFRLVHFSVQGTHVHFIVEADEIGLLSRGMQGLGVSMAKRINMTLDRSGPVFDDRFFARRLPTPREVANALDYVIHNHERHLRRQGLVPADSPGSVLLGHAAAGSAAAGGAGGDLVAEGRISARAKGGGVTRAS